MEEICRLNHSTLDAENTCQGISMHIFNGYGRGLVPTLYKNIWNPSNFKYYSIFVKRKWNSSSYHNIIKWVAPEMMYSQCIPNSLFITKVVKLAVSG